MSPPPDPAPALPLDLRLTEESLEDLYELAPCGYCSCLPDGTLVKLNRTLLGWLGYQREELVAQKCLQQLFTVGGRLHYELHCAPLLLLEGEVREVSYLLRCYDGRTLPVLLHAKLVRTPDGQPLVVRVTLFDITERHRYEQALLQARVQAEQQQEQLRVQNEQLLRTNADLDSFVYAASHDLKQPLNNMVGLFAELRRTAIFPDADATAMARMFEAALAQLLRTIAGLSEVVQQQRVPGPAAPAETELRPVVEDILSSLRPQLHAADVGITLDLAAAPWVRMAPAALHSVLYNLLSNALKYAAPGRRPLLRVRTTATESEVLIGVEDNGRGLDLARYGGELFQLFRRFHPEVEGTGTGLYLVNRLVHQAGGTMQVESALNQGTTFRVVLPR